MASPIPTTTTPGSSVIPSTATTTPPILGGPAMNQIGQNPPAASLTPQTASDLIASITNATQEFGQANAENAMATGDTGEETAYNTAGAIANANARLALVGGQVQQYQQGLQVQQTLGAQRAAVSAGGFAESGSSLALLRSSTQQGLLQQQITGVNSELQAGGYTEQGAAAGAEAAAAGAAAASSSALAANAQTIATTSKTNAINEAAALGLNIPGISNISATSMPAINPVTLSQTATQNSGVSPLLQTAETATNNQVTAAGGTPATGPTFLSGNPVIQEI
jgi:hypothetical protein